MLRFTALFLLALVALPGQKCRDVNERIGRLALLADAHDHSRLASRLRHVS